MLDLKKPVLEKIRALGAKSAAEFFQVSPGTITNWVAGKTNPPLRAIMLVLEASGEVSPIAGPDPLETWEGKNVIMLLPLYRGFSSDTHFSLFANYAKYGPEKIGMIMEKRTVIHESRNILTHKFLKTDAEWAIMCDDDMVLPCGSVEVFNGRYGANLNPKSAGLNAISRIMSHPADKRIVGALYFGRHARGRAQCASGFSNAKENENYHKCIYTGLRPEEWVGTGFIRVHRSVFEDMKAAIDGGKWPECKPPTPDSWYGFFNPIHVRVGEDVSFGRRATELGIRSYVDAELIALHTGEVFFGPHNTKA